MKLTSVWILGSLCVFCLPQPVVALATVESRTGQPVIRSEEPVIRSSGIHGSTDDRSAHLGLKHLDALQQEISDLRGLVETQDHEIQKLKKSQQDLYLDLDKRLSELKPRAKSNAVQGSKPSTSVTVVPIEEDIIEPSAIEILPEKPIKPSAAVTITPTGGSKSVQTATEKEVYGSAYNFVRTKQYAEAVTGFEEYLTRYPQGEQAANAHYWLGEVYMAKWQAEKVNRGLLDQATQSFINLKTGFKEHPKVADALLKLGVIETEKNNFVAAREYLTEVKTRYPSSSAARIAASRLQQLPSS